MQASMDDQNIHWNLLDLLADDWKDNNLSATGLLSLSSWGIYVLRDNYSTGQKCTDSKLHSILKSCFSFLKKLPARSVDYLQANDLLKLHHWRTTDTLFPKKFCGYYWLKNSNLTRFIEISGRISENIMNGFNLKKLQSIMRDLVEQRNYLD